MAQALLEARLLRRRKAAETDADEPKEKRRKTSAEVSRDYRERLKQDPELYQSYRNYENVRVKAYIATLDSDKKAMYREKTRLRVQRYRAKKKSEGAEKPPSKIKTRAEQEKQRTKWRSQKREQLASEGEERRNRRNAKRREKYAEKKKTANEKSSSTKQSNLPAQSSFNTQEALRKATYRASRSMPKSKEKAVNVLARMISSATPRKRKMLKDQLCSPKSKKGLAFEKTATAAIQSTLQSLKKARNKSALQQKRTIAYAIVKKYSALKQVRELGVGYKFAKKLKASSTAADLSARKVRKDAISDSGKIAIEQFFKRADVSRSLPDARAVKKGKDNDLVSRRVMERSLASAHVQFTEENPDTSISLSAFASLRPSDVMPCTKNTKRDCLCEYCANVDLKLEAMRNFNTKQGLGGATFKDKYDISRQSLCAKSENGEYHRHCLERNCEDCGVKLIEEKMQPLADSHAETPISYHKWSIVEIGGKKRMTRVTQTVTVSKFIKELKEELSPFSRHLFDASWQGRQYDRLSASPPEDHVVICQDFAENYTLRFQDEAQGAHWGYTQVTLHASVASYKCREDNCDETTSEAVIFVSDDLKHDHHAVHQYNKLLFNHLNVRAADKPFKKAVFFSDGAPTQYKNKTSFADLSCSDEDFNIAGERHFFGTRHGKGPCDREFGTLKRAVGLSVNNRRAELDSPKDLFEFCQNNYTRPVANGDTQNSGPGHSHYMRTFFYVAQDDVERERDRLEDLKPIPQTRRQHCVRMVEPFVVSYRERSCFCEACMTEEGRCPNADITGEWNVAVMKKHSTRRAGRQKESDAEITEQNDELVCEQRAADDLDQSLPDDQNTGQAVVPEEPDAEMMTQNEDVVCEQQEAHALDQSTPNDQNVGQAVEIGDKLLEPPIETRIQIGSWVKAELKVAGKAKTQQFFGLIISCDEDQAEAEVKYLRRRDGGYFTFPDIDDCSWESYSDLKFLPPPRTNKRMQHFFDNV